MSRVLVAGCGYVGIALGQVLARRGHEVFGLRRGASALPAPIVPIQADLERPDTLAGARYDALVFCAGPAASDEESYRRTYLTCLGHAIDAFPAGRVLFTSSTAVYAQRNGEWVEETSPAEPEHFSGRTLLEAERLLRGRCPEAVVLRLGGIYGPGRASLLDAVRRGDASVSADREPFVNRFHRDDCAGALAHLVELEDPAPTYLGVDDEPASRRRVTEWLCARAGAPPPRTAPPRERPSRRGDSNKRCSNALLRSSGYTLEFPTFREGYGALLELPDEPGSAGPDVG